MTVTRPAALRAAAALCTAHWFGTPHAARAVWSATEGGTDYAEVPLGLCGGGYCLTYSVDNQLFRAVVDTGSPFLIVDGTCDAGEQGRWGCYYGEARRSGLSDSELSFSGQDVGVQWRRGAFALTLEPTSPVSTGEALTIENAVFGVVRKYRGKGGSGAVFVGLVKKRGPRVLQPTLLEQTDIQSLRFNFLRRRLLFSRTPLIDRAVDAVPIVDLRPRAPDLKYSCRVTRLVVNGEQVRLDAPTVAILDTGTTGLQVSEELWDSGRLPQPLRNVRIELQTERGSLCALEASVRRRRPLSPGIPVVDVDPSAVEFDEFPLIASPVPIRWGTGRGGTPYVLFVGLAFLWQRQLTIDVDAQRLSIV